MPATKRLVLDLPADTVDAIEARVASGQFRDAPETVAAAVAQLDANDPELPPGATQEEWDAFAMRCRSVAARLDAGLETTFSGDEAREELARRRAVRAST